MFDQLLNLIAKVTDIRPKYTPEHCLVVTHAIGGCEECKKVCPHEAIEIKRQVNIDDIDCTGCGLCIQACPSQALEPNTSYQADVPLKCSQVKGSAQSVQCLGRLQATDILRLAGRRGKVTLVRNDCANCSIGNEAVLGALEDILKDAQTLVDTINLPLTTQVLVQEKFDATDLPDKVSRREFLRGGVNTLKAGTVDILAPLENLVSEGDNFLPLEHSKKLKLLELSELSPETEVPWTLPRVKEGCILCPVCTNVCPTKAFSREFENLDENTVSVLKLAPERCNGCDACTTSCPVGVITLDEIVTWGELSSGALEAYRQEDTPKSISRE